MPRADCQFPRQPARQAPMRDSSGRGSCRRDPILHRWWECGEERRGDARNSIWRRANPWRRPLVMLLIFGGLQAQAAPCGSGESSSSRVPQTGQQALPELWARSLRVKDGWQRGGRRQCQTGITYEGDAESCAALSWMVKGVDKAASFRGGSRCRSTMNHLLGL